MALLYLCNGTARLHISDLLPRGFASGELIELFEKVDRGDPLVEVGAYCLMPNHFHLLMREKEKNGISRFMQKITTGYTMYFNKRHERSGVLFQGVFKSTHAKEDRYLKYLLSYIHLNPVKLVEPRWKEAGFVNQTRAKKFLEGYHYSSYADYAGHNRFEQKIIAKAMLPEYFLTPKDFKKNITEWLVPPSPPR